MVALMVGKYFYKEKLIASGTEVVELSIGERDIGTDPAILNAMYEAALNGHTGYASVPGIEKLRSSYSKSNIRKNRN